MISKAGVSVGVRSFAYLKGTCAGVCALILCGCVDASNLTPSSQSDVSADTKTVKVVGQDVIIGRAAGYCFNDQQSRFASTGAFVVMAPCDPTDEDSTAKGLILVNVLAETGIMDAIKSRDLEAYFKSDVGRAALSRKGNAEKLRILGTMSDDGIYYVHTMDADGPIIPDTTDDQWRVFMVAADRLVSVSVVNFLDDKMPDGMVFSHMEAIAKRIATLN